MAAPKKYFERHSLASALGTSLASAGWTDIGQIREGFQSQEPIQPPTVSVHFLPSKYIELQLGRSISTDKVFERQIQIDCYMETEPRAMTITDDIAEFLDALFIGITTPSGAILGHLYVPDSESIITDTQPPKVNDPISIRWRGIVMATLEADYF